MCDKVAVKGLFVRGNTGDQVQRDTFVGHPRHGVDDLGKQGGGDQTGTVGQNELDPFGLAHQSANHRQWIRHVVADPHQQRVDAQFVRLLGEVDDTGEVERAGVVFFRRLLLTAVER
ncbi:hypothetical protein D3C80_1668270 [compost metagenome]